MPRISKCRRVCAEPKCRLFLPGTGGQRECVVINVEELEALRLCDLEGLDQEEAARHMDVSRGTVQRILTAARRKAALALVDGKSISIEGGHYTVTDMRFQCSQNCMQCPYRWGEDSTTQKK
ncbi:DUF134 domain-containing protein [Solibaculum mannosilyticum]|uniref:UPF0251 protein C12CBH8_11030 n=1 Tax=Solibaculum mannosilyticum TaxID=2780922 RepID=A0A7I8D752_9FIRM|nr:DUF134 domain-containing protein [Solibaculum mannosilyticum]MCO7138015.1 DUF134 domain-containing protein [[Clostridium] leptum]BCI60464.1 hypothetical protein C12CBH8_11030 [Solibaculum mannosilyticum]CZT57007.1 hypothetical protein BN3661_01731 [Eubacteriaceae bacterium CHKCI005]